MSSDNTIQVIFMKPCSKECKKLFDNPIKSYNARKEHRHIIYNNVLASLPTLSILSVFETKELSQYAYWATWLGSKNIYLYQQNVMIHFKLTPSTKMSAAKHKHDLCGSGGILMKPETIRTPIKIKNPANQRIARRKSFALKRRFL